MMFSWPWVGENSLSSRASSMASSPHQKKSQVITIAAGGMGGCLDALITMPLDTVKTYVQVNKGEHSLENV